MTSGGHLIVDCLKSQGIDRVFCVPGESYLDVLDGLYGSGIDVVSARHEGAAAMMADADGKLTGRPGIAMVTRGPGATNASAGVHVAAQDSTPMILLIGQVGRSMRGREAFQEVDYRQMFGSMAKLVEEIDHVDRIPEVMHRAFATAMAGRPGPVVVALPEDMLRDHTERGPGGRTEPILSAPSGHDVERFAQSLNEAKRPIVIVGGSRWDADAVKQLSRFSADWDLPVACSFRRQGLMSAFHPNYAGDVGLGINPALRNQIEQSDLVILLGCRFSENPSQGFELLGIPNASQKLVHIHPGPEELGRIYNPDLAINATPGEFLKAISGLEPKPGWNGQAEAAHRAYRDWTDLPPAGIGELTMSHVVELLREKLPANAILANGAGNYAIWLHRFYRYEPWSQLAPTSGSMGYGMPAAIAAALRFPDREVICLAGDGCFQMTGMEFGTAVQQGLNLCVLVCDNGNYGTIRMHQERAYPERPIATDLTNPDFAAWARSYGAVGLTVGSNIELSTALDVARNAAGPALVHLKLDPRDIAPGRTLS